LLGDPDLPELPRAEDAGRRAVARDWLPRAEDAGRRAVARDWLPRAEDAGRRAVARDWLPFDDGRVRERGFAVVPLRDRELRALV
jgi:hypothetical protein